MGRSIIPRVTTFTTDNLSAHFHRRPWTLLSTLVFALLLHQSSGIEAGASARAGGVGEGEGAAPPSAVLDDGLSDGWADPMRAVLQGFPTSLAASLSRPGEGEAEAAGAAAPDIDPELQQEFAEWDKQLAHIDGIFTGRVVDASKLLLNNDGLPCGCGENVIRSLPCPGEGEAFSNDDIMRAYYNSYQASLAAEAAEAAAKAHAAADAEAQEKAAAAAEAEAKAKFDKAVADKLAAINKKNAARTAAAAAAEAEAAKQKKAAASNKGTGEASKKSGDAAKKSGAGAEAAKKSGAGAEAAKKSGAGAEAAKNAAGAAAKPALPGAPSLSLPSGGSPSLPGKPAAPGIPLSSLLGALKSLPLPKPDPQLAHQQNSKLAFPTKYAMLPGALPTPPPPAPPPPPLPAPIMDPPKSVAQAHWWDHLKGKVNK